QVRLTDYSSLQRELRSELVRDPSGGWDGGGVRWRNVSSYKYGGGGYSSLVPLVLVQRDGAEVRRRLEDLQRSRPEEEREWLGEALNGWAWSLDAVSVQLYDLGVGVLTSVYEVSTPRRLDPSEARRTVESL